MQKSWVQTKQEYNGEWRSSLYGTFIDFDKAFDSQARSMEDNEKLWDTGEDRTITEVYKCVVTDETRTSEWFEIRSGVKQECFMSGFLSLLVINWIMRLWRASADKVRGIHWKFNNFLEDLDFADVIALV